MPWQGPALSEVIFLSRSRLSQASSAPGGSAVPGYEVVGKEQGTGDQTDWVSTLALPLRRATSSEASLSEPQCSCV